MNTLSVDDFVEIFGAPKGSLDDCRSIIESKDFRYTLVSSQEESDIVLGILKKIDNCEFSLSCDFDKWEAGWGKNLAAFKSSKSISSLMPVWSHSRKIVRLRGQYVAPVSLDFEQNCFKVLRYWALKNFINSDTIYDFGCGTGVNLLSMCDLFPSARIVGLDWSPSAVEIVNLLSKTNPNISGRLFDAFEDSIKLEDRSCVFTVGFLEQLHDKFHNFLDSIMKSKVRCIHMEPIEQFYDQNSLFDYIAYRYHHHRGYLKGFGTKLKSLDGIKILKEQKIQIGNMFHDGWSIMVWENY